MPFPSVLGEAGGAPGPCSAPSRGEVTGPVLSLPTPPRQGDHSREPSDPGRHEITHWDFPNSHGNGVSLLPKKSLASRSFRAWDAGLRQ